MKAIWTSVAFAAALSAAPSAWAGCKANIKMTNKSGTSIKVGTDTAVSNGKGKVKIKGGTWAKEYVGGKVTPGETQQRSVTLTFSCSKKRRWQFTFQPEGRTNTYTYYFPSNDGWTTSEDVDLGDVSRFFSGL